MKRHKGKRSSYINPDYNVIEVAQENYSSKTINENEIEEIRNRYQDKDNDLFDYTEDLYDN